MMQPPSDDEIRRTVAAVSQVDGFVTWPGVGMDEIARVEAALDVRLPDAYRVLLQSTNGFHVMHGHYQWCGIGPDAPFCLEGFNDPAGWLDIVPDGWLFRDDVVWLGINYNFGALGVLRSSGGKTIVTTHLTQRGQGLVQSIPLGLMFARGPLKMAREGFSEYEADLAAAVELLGGLEPGQGYVYGPRYYSDVEPDLAGARRTDLDLALRYAIDLGVDTERLTTEEHVVPVPWTDDKGRVRVRWLSERDHPGGLPGDIAVRRDC